MAWLTGFQYRKSIIINPQSGAGTDYQMGIKVYYGSGIDGTEVVNGTTMKKIYANSHCQADFDDIRFTEDDGETTLDQWLETKVDSDYAIFWIKITNSLESSPATIYIYCGNAEVTPVSEGDNVFRLYDHFDDESLDTAKWDEGGTGTAVETGTELTITSGNALNNHKHINSDVVYGVGIAVEMRIKKSSSVGYAWAGMTTIKGSSSDLPHTCSFRSGGEAYFSWISGDGTNSNSANYTISKDTNYHRSSTKRSATPTDHLFLDNEENSGTEYPTVTDRYVSLNAFCGIATQVGVLVVDWIAVRKFVSPEPAWGASGSWEQGTITMTVTSSPVTGIDYTFDGNPFTTPHGHEVEPDSEHTIVMPESDDVSGDHYRWWKWDNESTNRTRVVSSSIDVEYTGYFVKQYALTVKSEEYLEDPITGIVFTLNTVEHETQYGPVYYDEDTEITLVMPFEQGYWVWKWWKEDESENTIKVFDMTQNYTWTGVFTLSPEPSPTVTQYGSKPKIKILCEEVDISSDGFNVQVTSKENMISNCIITANDLLSRSYLGKVSVDDEIEIQF